jgi:hypothetical protein
LDVVLQTAEDAPTRIAFLGACPWNVAEFMSLFFSMQWIAAVKETVQPA